MIGKKRILCYLFFIVSAGLFLAASSVFAAAGSNFILCSGAVAFPSCSGSAFPTPTLNWTLSGVGTQDAYNLETDDDSDFSSPEISTGAIVSSSSSYTVSADALDFATLYYWRIKVRDSYGTWSVWTNGDSFTTPGAGSNFTLCTGAVNQEMCAASFPNPTLNWSCAGGQTNQWVAVGQGGNTIAHSADGIAWTGLGKSIFSSYGFDVAASGTRWVAVGAGTVNSIAFSNNGISWIGIGKSIFSVRGSSVAWDGSKWVAGGTGTSHTLGYSLDDGATWTGLGTTIFNADVYGVAWNGSVWVAVGAGTANSMAYSADGITWTGLGKSIFSAEGRNVAWNGSVWVAVGAGTANNMAYSADGITWTGLGKSIFSSHGSGVAWDGSKFVAAGSGTANTMAYSADGITWTGLGKTIFSAEGRNVAWNGSMWVAVGIGTVNNMAYSADGITWTGLGKTIFSDAGYSIASIPGPQMVPTVQNIGSCSQITYQVQVDNNSDFSSPEIDSGCVSSADNFFTVNTAGLDFETLYYWRVTIQEALGQTSGWVNGDPFTTTAECVAGANDLSVSEEDYCAFAGHYFSWVYTGGGDETRYQLQVDNNSDFSSPEVDRDRTDLSNPALSVNSETVTVAVAPGSDQIGYNTTYYWRVKVWDSGVGESSWIEGPSFETEDHRYPYGTSVSWVPSFFDINEDVTFSSNFICYDINNNPVACASWAWSFADGSPAVSSLVNPIIQFISRGFKVVTLSVSDSDGNVCPLLGGSRMVSVQEGLPVWKEITPR